MLAGWPSPCCGALARPPPDIGVTLRHRPAARARAPRPSVATRRCRPSETARAPGTLSRLLAASTRSRSLRARSTLVAEQVRLVDRNQHRRRVPGHGRKYSRRASVASAYFSRLTTHTSRSTIRTRRSTSSRWAVWTESKSGGSSRTRPARTPRRGRADCGPRASPAARAAPLRPLRRSCSTSSVGARRRKLNALSEQVEQRRLARAGRAGAAR